MMLNYIQKVKFGERNPAQTSKIANVGFTILGELIQNELKSFQTSKFAELVLAKVDQLNSSQISVLLAILGELNPSQTSKIANVGFTILGELIPNELKSSQTSKIAELILAEVDQLNSSQISVLLAILGEVTPSQTF